MDKYPMKVNTVKQTDRNDSQGYVDLKKQTANELLELIERQNKLLQNKSFLQKLPDKGEKIIIFKSELENELKQRQVVFDSACQLLSKLTIHESTPSEIEWNHGASNFSKQSLDSDDDDDDNNEDEKINTNLDPLKLIASHSGTAIGMKTKLDNQKNDSQNIHLHYINKICEKYDAAVTCKERFKPNQLPQGNDEINFVSAEKVKKRLGHKWEITQATPPIFNLNSTKAITLSESLILQKKHNEMIKEVEKKYATEKLLLNRDIKMGQILPTKNTETYRSNEDSDDKESDEKYEEFSENES